MKVCVTGGSGYIGTAVVPYLLQQGLEVKVLETMTFGNSIQYLESQGVEFIQGDIRDPVSVKEAVAGCDVVIHLAAIVTDELVDMNPEYSVAVNKAATRLLCEEANKAGVQRFIYASSSSVYGSSGQDCTEVTIPKPETQYARTKLDGESIVRFCSGDMCATWVRCATACGPSPRFRADTIINTFSGQAWFDHKIIVWDGTQWRSNIHIQDVARFYYHLTQVDAELVSNRGFNLTKENHTALELGQMVLDVYNERVGGKCELIVDTDKVDTRQYRMNASFVTRKLNWEPIFTLEDAALMNFEFFHQGNITDFKDSLYWNNRRMADIVRQG